MRIAYLDCASGISGDMTLGALIDAGVDLAAVQAGIDSLGLPSCRLAVAEVKKSGFRALQLTVEHEPEHKHRHLHHITAMIERSTLTPRQRELATRIFRRLAEAEAKVHGTTIEKVHFHEVGAVDSIADIVGSAIAWDLLGVERIVCSPVPTGTGFIEIAHGRCSIPAPATAELLRGVPLADFAVEGELTTPTGAAIVAALVDEFGPLPAMTIERIGYGAGQKDFTHPNLLRLMVGETAPATGQRAGCAPIADAIVLLETNLDDATGESLGYCRRATVAGRRPRRVDDAAGDEEESAGRAAGSAVLGPRTPTSWPRSCFARRRRSACGGRPSRGLTLPRRSVDGRHAVRRHRRRRRDAARRRRAVLAGIRSVRRRSPASRRAARRRATAPRRQAIPSD